MIHICITQHRSSTLLFSFLVPVHGHKSLSTCLCKNILKWLEIQNWFFNGSLFIVENDLLRILTRWDVDTIFKYGNTYWVGLWFSLKSVCLLWSFSIYRWAEEDWLNNYNCDTQKGGKSSLAVQPLHHSTLSLNKSISMTTTSLPTYQMICIYWQIPLALSVIINFIIAIDRRLVE